MQLHELVHYGLRVVADYRHVDIPPGQATWLDDETLELSGCVELHVERRGKLRLRTRGDAFVTLGIRVTGNLVVEYLCCVDGVVRMDRTIVLNDGASVTDVTAVEVHGRFDCLTRVEHHGRSSSRIVAKLAVWGKGHAIARGAICMDASSAGSDGFERIDALILEEGGVADVLPTLATPLHDVRLKHAASVGSVDADVLEYCGVRGIPKQEATMLIAQGFLRSVYGRAS